MIKTFQNSLTKKIIENSRLGLIVVDRHLKIQYASQSHLDQLGIPKSEYGRNILALAKSFIIEHEQFLLFRKNLSLLLDDPEVHQFKQKINMKWPTQHVYDISIRASLDKTNYVSQKNQDKNILIIYENITEFSEMKREFQKLASLKVIKKLAQGIAHDFNNILASILGNVNLIGMNLEGILNNMNEIPEQRCAKSKNGLLEIKDFVGNVSESVNKAISYTDQLFGFAISTKKGVKISNIGEKIGKIVDFSLVGTNVKYELDIEENLWEMKFKENEFDQIIFHLLMFAAKSMPIMGKVRIKAKNLHTEQKISIPFKDKVIPPGDYVKIEVIDQGMGISEQEISSILDPLNLVNEFSKTKELVLAYSLIAENNGFITIESKINEGTHVSLYIPVIGEEKRKKKQKQKAKNKGSGHIIIMDDEKEIIMVLKLLLEKIGYTVHTTTNGTEALNTLKKTKQKGIVPKFLILDYTIKGGLGAADIIDDVKEIDPNLKVILCSGYYADEMMKNPKKHGFSGFLQKPFQIEDLTSILSEK